MNGPYDDEPSSIENVYLSAQRSLIHEDCGGPYYAPCEEPESFVPQVTLQSVRQGETSGPIRVTHVGPCLVSGGVEQHLSSLVRFLDPSRVVIQRCIVTQANLVNQEFCQKLGLPVEVGQQEAVRRAAEDSDVLLYWGIGLDNWLTDVKPPLCVFLAHGEADWTRSTLMRNHRITDHVIAVSQRAKKLVCDGFETTVIPNGIDTARLATTRSRKDVRESLGFGPHDFLLGIVARFSSEKRFELLIETVASLPRNFKMLAVGFGPKLTKYLEMANRLIPNRYAFVSATDYLGDYYQAMDAYCMTSEHEGFGLVVLEAMFHGLPIIATEVGAVPELITHGQSGMIVDGDPHCFAEAAKTLQTRRAWANALGTEARQFAMQHGHARQMADRYTSLLEQLVKQKRSPGSA
ncbi:glycosyltransferase family 4 protein [Bremerella sp. P1]|uniref:glycosyltransferase family 4 protein n=1 Tax=Bremerella sp. P1 TaxID=3026424 RepID=UPI002367E80A|nr:glycosyltransferase family 4 protein [Bremerella sp. P1]WDI40597.1 glycosyltransferase family 4 protein [Bremerella sp. P1]